MDSSATFCAALSSSARALSSSARVLASSASSLAASASAFACALATSACAMRSSLSDGSTYVVCAAATPQTPNNPINIKLLFMNGLRISQKLALTISA